MSFNLGVARRREREAAVKNQNWCDQTRWCERTTAPPQSCRDRAAGTAAPSGTNQLSLRARAADLPACIILPVCINKVLLQQSQDYFFF